jgi:UDP-N-acetylmuramoyl-L-alanyl-D-glutamate--2,6-diaminopimelate ligase
MEKITLGDLLPTATMAPFVAELIVQGIGADSRQISSGDLFFALPGDHVDGYNFVHQAITNGALAVVTERPIERSPIPCIVVSNARQALAYAAARWHNFPARDLFLIGITGTDGKSSTVYFTQQLLVAMGIRAGFFSTVAYQAGDSMGDNTYRQSTLEAMELNGILAQMRQAGLTHGVIEATSHGLSDRTARLFCTEFRAGVFTNLSHEHLEFHGTFEAYASDKANLFRRLVPWSTTQKPVAVINAGDPMADYMASQTKGGVFFYQTLRPQGPKLRQPQPDLWADELEISEQSTDFTLHYGGEQRRGTMYLQGLFNLDNVLAAISLCSQILGRSPFDFLKAVESLKSVKGRMCALDLGQKFRVLIDYAHTPGAFQTIFPTIRASTSRRLIAVFGSGGERDRAKRPLQGAIAAAYADIIILCNEDPRLEDPMQILAEIKAGIDGVQGTCRCAEVLEIPERPEALARALGMAKPGDTVLLLGKGHEQSIIKADGKHPYDEEQWVRRILISMQQGE